jgi:hypothetical protein
MSLATGGNEATILDITGSSAISRRSVVTDGLTSTRPATSDPCSSASRSASAPPIDSPPTTTVAQLPASSVSSSDTRPYQSVHLVRFISRQSVPWPGSRGQRTVIPSPARCSPHGRRLCGVPVNPWHSNTPRSVEPSWVNGSAPGSTGTGEPPARGDRWRQDMF